MQKKLIALAVAGLVSAPAFAQSNVQIYGIMDIGVRHLSSSDNGFKSRTGVDHSGQASSRLGFRGTEDLGNGLKAFFTIEQALSNDTSAAGGNRQAFVGLEGGFGRVWMGRDFNPSRALISGLDPFGATGIGSGQQLFEQQTRYDNAIMYRSPNFGGLTVTAAFTNHVGGNSTGQDESPELKGGPDLNSKGWSITPTYKNGPLTAGFGYEKYSDDDVKRWNLGGSYDFGIVDLRLAYGQTKDDANDTKRKSWMLAGVIPVSASGKILASYVQTKLDWAGSDEKAKQYAVGYIHSLSKRTSVYGTYAKISTNNSAEGQYGLATSNPGSGGLSAASYTSGFNVGIRHNF